MNKINVLVDILLKVTMHFMHLSPHLACWWRFSDILHCHDGKADCQESLYIFSVRICVSHVHIWNMVLLSRNCCATKLQKFIIFKMGSPIDPGNLVSQGYANLWKNSMDDNIINIHTLIQRFANPCETTVCRFCLALWETPIL